MLWGWIPVARLANLSAFIVSLYVMWVSFAKDMPLDEFLVIDTTGTGDAWIYPIFIELIVVTTLYVLFNARSEIWLIMTAWVIVAFAFLNQALFASIFKAWVLYYVAGMVQRYDYLFENHIVNVNMLIFLNLTLHVTLDLYDIRSMVISVRSLDIDSLVIPSYLDGVTIGFAVCGFFFHSQSFPSSLSSLRTDGAFGVNMLTTEKEEEKETEICFERETATNGYKRKYTSVRGSKGLEALISDIVKPAPGSSRYVRTCCRVVLKAVKRVSIWGKQLIYYPKGEPHDEEYHAVIIARKRSAVISVLFVDVPFLIIRVIIIVATNSAEADSFVRFLAVKNAVCILLQPLWMRIAQKMEGRSAGEWGSVNQMYAKGLRQNHLQGTLALQVRDDEDSHRAVSGIREDASRASGNFQDILEWSSARRPSRGTPHPNLISDMLMPRLVSGYDLSVRAPSETSDYAHYPPSRSSDAEPGSLTLTPIDISHPRGVSPLIATNRSPIHIERPPHTEFKVASETPRGCYGRLRSGIKAWTNRTTTIGSRSLRRFIWRFIVVSLGANLSFIVSRTNFYQDLRVDEFTPEERGTILGLTPLAER